MLCGCQLIRIEEENKTPLAYTGIEDSQIPEEMQELIREKKETENVIKVTLPQLEEMAEKKMLSPAVWDHMAGYKDEFYRLFD